MTKKEIQALIDKDFKGDVNKFYEKYPTVESFRDGGNIERGYEGKRVDKDKYIDNEGILNQYRDVYDREGNLKRSKEMQVSNTYRPAFGDTFYLNEQTGQDIDADGFSSLTRSNPRREVHKGYSVIREGDPTTGSASSKREKRHKIVTDKKTGEVTPTYEDTEIFKSKDSLPTPGRNIWGYRNRINGDSGYDMYQGYKNGGRLPSFQQGGTYDAYNNQAAYNPTAVTDPTAVPDAYNVDNSGDNKMNAAASAIPIYGQFAQMGKVAQEGVQGPNIQDEITGQDTGITKNTAGYTVAQGFTPHKEFIRNFKDVQSEGLGTKEGRKAGFRMLAQTANPFAGAYSANQRNKRDLAEYETNLQERKDVISANEQTARKEASDLAWKNKLAAAQAPVTVSPYQEFYGPQTGVNPVQGATAAPGSMSWKNGGFMPHYVNGGNEVQGAQQAPGGMNWEQKGAQYMVDNNEHVTAANGDVSQVVADNPNGTDTVAVTENNNGVPVALGGGKLVPLHKAENGGKVNDSTYIATDNFNKAKENDPTKFNDMTPEMEAQLKKLGVKFT